MKTKPLFNSDMLKRATDYKFQEMMNRELDRVSEASAKMVDDFICRCASAGLEVIEVIGYDDERMFIARSHGKIIAGVFVLEQEWRDKNILLQLKLRNFTDNKDGSITVTNPGKSVDIVLISESSAKIDFK